MSAAESPRHPLAYPSPDAEEHTSTHEPESRQHAVTVGEMMHLWTVPGPPVLDRLTLIWKPPSCGFPAGSSGLVRLERIARNEWGTELDPGRFSLLRDHLHWFAIDRNGSPAGSDIIDALTLDEAAEVLEQAIGDPPSRKLLDDTCSVCHKCGGPIDETRRAQRSAWCDGCRSPQGRVMELDIAFKTYGDGYDQAGNDRLEVRFPEWREISTFICDQFHILKVNQDAWDRFRKWFILHKNKNWNEFLHLKRTELLAILRRTEPAHTEPVRVSAPEGQLTPPPSGTEAPADDKQPKLNPGSKALAAAYELKKEGKPVSFKAACDRAGVCRKNVRSRFPEVVETIRQLAAPDRTVFRGTRNQRTGNLDAVDEADD